MSNFKTNNMKKNDQGAGRGQGRGRGAPRGGGDKSNKGEGNKSGGGARGGYVKQASSSFYEEYLPVEQIEEGMGQQYFQGILKVNPRKKVEAYVRPEGFNIDLRVDDEKARNRSLHGDLVALELLPEAEWAPWSSMLQAKLGLELGDTAAGGELPARVPSQNPAEKRLWAPKQGMIDGFRSQADVAKRAAATAGKHPIEARSLELNLQPRARVVSVLEARHASRQVGTLTLQNGAEDRGFCAGQKLPDAEKGVFFVPSDTRFPNMFVSRLSLPESFVNDPFNGLKQIFIGDIVADWPCRSRMPLGDNVRSLGESGEIAAETEALLTQFMCNHAHYTEDALEPLRKLLGEFGVGAEEGAEGWQIPAAEVARRRDLRSYRIFTIDPPNAKDLDDALHVTPLPDGTYEIGVHIADVAFFLEAGTALDDEAQKRATSVYLVQKVIPMLPSILCEQLCSLNPNVDRLAFSCIWRMNADGTMHESPPWFGKTVIRSCAKLDYPTAQRMIDGEIPSQPDTGQNPDSFLASLPDSVWELRRRPTHPHAAWACANDVVMMRNIAMQRRKERLSNGALVLTNKKLIFKLDEHGNPMETTTYTIRESNQLVEEYMLMANYLVAGELIDQFGEAGFIRQHPPPDPSGMENLHEVFAQLGYELDTSSAQTVQASLNNVARTGSAMTLQIVSILLTLPMPEAQYLVAGMDPVNWNHYALSIPYYTHFTSPIRRYADVMVHRQLELSIRAKKASAIGAELLTAAKSDEAQSAGSAVAEQCNIMKRASKSAQDASDRVYFAIFLKDKPMDVSGYVVGVGEKSFTVYVPEFGISERLFLDNMPGVTSTWDATTKSLQLHRSAAPGAVAKFASSIPDKMTFTGSLHVKMLTGVFVHLSTCMAPLNVQMSLIGPDDSALSLERV